MKRIYLGDAVYAEIEHDSLKLTTEGGPGGIGATNTIYLEPEVVSALITYLRQIMASNGLEFCPECERRKLEA